MTNWHWREDAVLGTVVSVLTLALAFLSDSWIGDVAQFVVLCVVGLLLFKLVGPAWQAYRDGAIRRADKRHFDAYASYEDDALATAKAIRHMAAIHRVAPEDMRRYHDAALDYRHLTERPLRFVPDVVLHSLGTAGRTMALARALCLLGVDRIEPALLPDLTAELETNAQTAPIVRAVMGMHHVK